jgi:hypothetical protein
MAQGREDLIHSLAKSMGMDNAQKTRFNSGKYNPETGILYANGHTITKNTIEQARSYFTTQYRKLAEKDDEGAKQLAMIYEVAMESIGMVVESGQKPEGE